MKKLIYFFLLLQGLTAAADPGEPAPVVREAFAKTFESAVHTSWSVYENYSVAWFEMGGIQARVYYSNSGELLKTIRYYDKSYLPFRILAAVNKKYAGREITGVTELNRGDETSYQVTLRDDRYWYQVHSDGFGNLEQEEKFSRAETH